MSKMSRKGAGGPKPSRWRKASSISFENWLSGPAIVSEEPDELRESAAATIVWSFTLGKEESADMIGLAGDRVQNVATGESGVLVRKGSGSTAGEGTCHSYFVVSVTEGEGTREEEVEEWTTGALRRTRGFSSDLLLRLDDGRDFWCTAHHVQLLEPECAHVEPVAE